MRTVFQILSLIAVLAAIPLVYQKPDLSAMQEADTALPLHYDDVRSFLESRMNLADAGFDELTRTILSEASRAELEPQLIVGLIHVESSGDPFAISNVGALGLMQLLPTTGEAMAIELGLEWNGPESLFDPNLNVRLGVRYLSQLVARFDSIDTALAAYNWGPTHIARALRRGRDVPARYSESVLRARVAII